MMDYIVAYEARDHVYHREAVRLVGKFETDAHVDERGVVRWSSNEQVPPMEVLALWHYLDKPFSLEASRQQYDEDLNVMLDDYRARRADGPTDEERFEARAAHGPGVELVDVITGHRWTT